jgi:hypothetical protein
MLVAAKPSNDVPMVVIVCIALLTLAWPLAALQVSRLWRHVSGVIGVGGSPASYRHARLRALPTLVGAALALLVSAWLYVADPPSGSTADVPQVVALVSFIIAISSALAIAPLVVLFNHPKALVPPHMRHEPGFLNARRSAGQGTR